ncbi:hypothetical protein BKA81DRAFT_402112 [Phyllosticta paracitricarpa]
MFFAAVRGASSEQQAEGRERWRRWREAELVISQPRAFFLLYHTVFCTVRIVFFLPVTASDRHKQACRSTVVNATVKHINAPQKVESNGSTYDDDVDGCGTNADSEATELVACLLAYSYVLQEFHSSDVPWLTSWLQKQRHIIYSLTHSLTASSNAQKSPGHSSGRAIHAIHHLPSKTTLSMFPVSTELTLGRENSSDVQLPLVLFFLLRVRLLTARVIALAPLDWSWWAHQRRVWVGRQARTDEQEPSIDPKQARADWSKRDPTAHNACGRKESVVLYLQGTYIGREQSSAVTTAALGEAVVLSVPSEFHSCCHDDGDDDDDDDYDDDDDQRDLEI